MTFPSKVDSWFYLVIIVVAGTILATAIPVLKLKGAAGLPALILPGIVAIGLPLWILFSTRYEVTSDKLVVKCAFLTRQLNRADIHSIKPTNSLLSAPALSIDRLEIRYGNSGVIVVSPKDRDGFIAALGLSLSQ